MMLEPEELALMSSSVDISLAHESWLLSGFDSDHDIKFYRLVEDRQIRETTPAGPATNRSDT